MYNAACGCCRRRHWRRSGSHRECLMIPLMKSTFLHDHETRMALAEFIVRSKRLSMDIKCFEFEKAFARHEGAAEAVLFNSGGSANLAILQALRNLGRLHHGARIGFSALTWSTNVMPIVQMGMIPVPVDCQPTTLNSMQSNLSERLNDVRLDAFFLTNAVGFAGHLDMIRAFCDAERVLL